MRFKGKLTITIEKAEMHISIYFIAILLATISQNSRFSLQEAPQDDALTGTWMGTSICQVKNSPCKNETVVFHFYQAAETYTVTADKIVNGQPINMGKLNFTLNKSTLTCVQPTGTWVLKVNNNHIDGTLITADKVLYRKLSLTKTPAQASVLTN
ncbi:hypothetical protein [Dinghuibacter silviterrae]|uniref:Uncharacterized protein n=1 Tax=Dinghuibacter silviterrae TaxID=1539049 RepID=A0A4R8DFE7_9BACT|nr:hypothetical protein [Dinghuibacter silviterrae]TDW96185.1 hypothetical protein EDB95_4009 [Dinghuibacter silviterrae]